MIWKKSTLSQARKFEKICFFFLLLAVSVSVNNCKPHTSETEENLETDGADKAKQQEFLMTRDPVSNIVPKERLLTALSYMNSMRTTQPAALAWQERGPNNIGGRSRAILIDKRDPT